MEAMMVDYHALSRKELQALCKQHKIPANKTNLFMADSLAALLGNANANEPEVVDAPISGAKEADFVGMTEPPVVLRAEESVGEAPCESPADDADNTIAVVKKASKGRAAKKSAAATPTPVGSVEVCSALKPATKRATVSGKVSSLAKLTATEINEGSDEAAAEVEAEGKPAGRKAAANVKTAKLSNLKEDSCVTLQELGPEEMAGEFVADSEVPAAPQVVEVKKAVKRKRNGKKAQIDVIEQAVVETATMVIEEATLMEEAPVIEERNKAAPVPEALMETKKISIKNPVEVPEQIGEEQDVTQIVEVLEDSDRDTRLMALLRRFQKCKKNQVLVYVLYKEEALHVESLLQQRRWKVAAVHGGIFEADRNKAIVSFQKGSSLVLVATDVAARGLVIPNVDYVINYSFPYTFEDYACRLRQTGRTGRKGIMHTFFLPSNQARAKELVEVLREAEQDVPENLVKLTSPAQKKRRTEY